MENTINNANFGFGANLDEEISKEIGEVSKTISSIKDPLDYVYWDKHFDEYLDYVPKHCKGRTRRKRLLTRLLDEGRAINPCGKECAKWGDIIINSLNHSSFMNSEYLVDDMEYLYHAAKITPNPQIVNYFFYEYVNEYLKKNAKFRLQFLKSLYLNQNVLTKDDILWFVENYDYHQENEIITHDEEFLKALILNFANDYDVSENANVWKIYHQMTRKKLYSKYNKELGMRKERLRDLLTAFNEIIEFKKLESNKNI